MSVNMPETHPGCLLLGQAACPAGALFQVMPGSLCPAAAGIVSPCSLTIGQLFTNDRQ